jgi:hypothetical protein
VFDRAVNIGPTLWWDGEIIGSWATAPDGDLLTHVVADRGVEAQTAIDRAASQLRARLDGAAATPAIRIPPAVSQPSKPSSAASATDWS